MTRNYYEAEAARLRHLERYHDYLRSGRWADIKREIWWRDEGYCQRCGEKCGRDLPGNVHHKTYRNLFNEHNHLNDLELLCRDCHRAQHGFRT